MRPTRPWQEMIIEWAPDLAEKLGRPIGEIIEHGLSAYDFPSGAVEIREPEDMVTRISSAFAVIRPKQHVVAVFSEHCGYLEFDLREDTVVAEITEKIYTHWGDDDV